MTSSSRRSSRPSQLAGSVAVTRLGGELRDVSEEAGAQRVGVAVVDVEAGVGELDREPPHRSDHEVGALAMPPFRGEFAE